MEECVAGEQSMCCASNRENLRGSTAVLLCITRHDRLRFIRGHHCLEDDNDNDNDTLR